MTQLIVRSKEEEEEGSWLSVRPSRNGVPLWVLNNLYRAKRHLHLYVPRRWLDVDAFFVTTRSLSRGDEEADRQWEVRWATREDADALQEVDAAAGRMARDRLGEGYSIILVERAGHIVAFKVMATRHRLQGFYDLVLPDDSVFNVFVWVSPRWRARGLLNVMRQFTDQRWRHDGFRRSFATVDALKRLLAVERKSKGRILYRVFYVRVFDCTALRINRSWRFGRWSEARPFRLDLTGH